jgi:hypothetical protein
MWKSAGHAPSFRVLPWHLPYNWGKNTEKTLSQLPAIVNSAFMCQGVDIIK